MDIELPHRLARRLPRYAEARPLEAPHFEAITIMVLLAALCCAGIIIVILAMRA